MLWKILPQMPRIDARLRDIGPMGYSLVVNVRGLTPEYYVSTFPAAWVRLYNRRQYAVFDPVSIWARTNSGRIRWSGIRGQSLSKVQHFILERAREHGLTWGGGVSRSDPEGGGTFSFLFCARSDRELTEAELREIEGLFEEILAGVAAEGRLSQDELQILTALGEGFSHKEIAQQQAISPETVKKRLERIRRQLRARNSTHAVTLAMRRGLILNLPDDGEADDEARGSN